MSRLHVRVAKLLLNKVVGPVIGKTCPACGRRTVVIMPQKFPARLSAEWKLSPAWHKYFEIREMRRCAACRSSERDRQLARVILREFGLAVGSRFDSLPKLVSDQRARALRVAEINSLGVMHPMIAPLPNLSYSEYGSTDPNVPSENLLALSYPSDYFDFVLTSETLEHVPDVDAALAEIARVLKPGGKHVFTIPVVTDGRETVQRASLRDGKLVHHHPPSYHGDLTAKDDFIVFYEFGADVDARIAAAGFDVERVVDANNPSLVVYVATKRPA